MSQAEAPIRAPRPAPVVGYAVAVLSVAVATVLAVLADSQVRIPNLSLIYVLPVVFAAARFGGGSALAAAVLSAVAYNYFLIEPRYTLRVADPANVWALLTLLTIAAVVSAVAAQARARALEALDAASQAGAVHALAQSLVAEMTRAGVARRCAEALTELFHAPAVVVLHDPDGDDLVEATGGAVVGGPDLEAARWASASGLATRGGAWPVPEATFDFWPVKTAQRQQAVIGVAISGRETGRPAGTGRLVDTVSGYLAVALDREAYARQLLAAQVEAAGEKVRIDLLAAVSHDLRTPLSTILFTLQSLQRFGAQHDTATQGDLLAAAEGETARLIRMVGNLLDMNRVEAGALVVRPAPAAVSDLAAAAIARAGAALDGRTLANQTVDGRRLLVDAALFESALANVLENAGKYSPAGSVVRMLSGHDDTTGWIEVLDEGPGFDGPTEPLFGKFARGVAGDGRAPGTGLGLSIARSFLAAQRGRVEAFNRDDGPGARVRLTSPLAPA